MTNNFKSLIRLTGTNWMNTTASSTQVLILLHQIDEKLYCRRLKVNITVKCQQKRILRDDLLAIDTDR